MSLVTGSIDTASQNEADAYVEVQTRYLEDYYIPRDQWQRALSVLVGVYSLIKQHQIMKEYLDLAKEQVAQAERYLRLTEDHYNNISVPTFECQKKLFERYVNDFSNYENRYLQDAFRLKEYEPEYKLQEGRALSTVQMMFDKARLQRRRQVGKYNTGRACHDNTYFLTMQAMAKVSAANHAYRFEENRKFKLDQWYWQRRTAGIGIVDGMANRVVSGLNGGAQVATQGINAVGNALGRVQDAFGFVENGYTNLANFWGSAANAAFQFAGYSYGRSQAMPFGSGDGPRGLGVSMQSGVPGSPEGSGLTQGYNRGPSAVAGTPYIHFAAE